MNKPIFILRSMFICSQLFSIFPYSHIIREEQIVRWFTQATLALKYLHDKHILHRGQFLWKVKWLTTRFTPIE